MKKMFSLIDEKKKPDRVADQIKFEIKKYIKRERNKKLPEGVDFWDFDCRIGINKNTAKEVHLTKISEGISKMVADNIADFYIEILAKPGVRSKKPTK